MAVRRTHAWPAAALVAATACGEARREIGESRRDAPPPAAEFRGHIVLPSETAAGFSVPADSAIPELAPAAVAPAVRRAADAEARAAEFRAECTRYFAAKARVLALLLADCAGEPGTIQFDGVLLAAFTADGQRVGPVAGPYGEFYTDVVPHSRDLHGHPGL